MKYARIERKTHRCEFRIKRVYDKPSRDDGQRFLVDRLWPRGLRKEALASVEWLRDMEMNNASVLKDFLQEKHQ